MDEACKQQVIQQYFDTVRAKDELMELIQQQALTLEQTARLMKLNEEQHQLVAQMIDLQLIQIHISEE